MSSPLCFNRSSRIERQAYKWVMKMFDDPGHHAPALAKWLDKDPEHRVVYKRVAIEVGYASDAAAQLPSLRADARMAATHASATPPGRRLLTAGVVAAAILMLLLLGWQASRSAIFQPASDKPMIQTAGISGGTKSLTLTDGSQIVLLGATSLRVRYGPAERAIDLQNGRARFTVAHDVARPFVVHVRGGTVTAVGTIFEVDADRIASPLAAASAEGVGNSRSSPGMGVATGSPNACTSRAPSVRAAATVTCWPSTARTASSNPSSAPGTRTPSPSGNSR